LAVNTSPKPTAAFALSALAGLITLVSAFIAGTVSSLLIPGISSTMILVWGSIAGILVLVGSWLLYSNAAQRKIGSILVLVFSVISLNFVGLILGLIGGFLGYTFKGTSVSTSNSSSRSLNPP
jgi:ABC-type transporter Mla maintaining outer membrane lipid asymmetry permease subunit MlaE